MVNIPIWDQCTTEYLLKMKEHFEGTHEDRRNNEVKEHLSQIDLVLKERDAQQTLEGE